MEGELCSEAEHAVPGPGRLDCLGPVDGFPRASLSQATAVPCALCELGSGQGGFQRPQGEESRNTAASARAQTVTPLPPQQAFNAAAVVHHMRKLHMNLHSPSVRQEVENRPPVSPAPEVSSPGSHDSSITEAPILDPSTPLPALTPLACSQSSRPSAPGGRSLNCLVNGSLRISSSLVPMQQGPLGTGPCGCCSSCLNIGNKGKSSYCSEPTLFRKANKKQYVVSGHEPHPGRLFQKGQE